MKWLRSYPWRLFFFLWIMGTATAPLVLPYFLRLMEVAPGAPEIEGNPLLLIVVRVGIVTGIAAFFGLPLARSVGLGAPYLERQLYGSERLERRPIFGVAVLWAAVTALAAFVVDWIFLFGFGITHPAPEIHARIPGVEAWRGIPASFYGGITEEITYRLFLMSLVAWIAVKLLRAGEEGRRRTVALWTGNLVAALLFGWAHMSGVLLFGEAPTLAWVRTFLIILIPGVAFGWLYWKRGLEAAMVSHFVIDIIVHVLRPLVDPGS